MSKFLGPCPKCGEVNVRNRYDRSRDRIDRHCPGCDYRWLSEPLDKHPAVIALKELGHAV